MTRQQLFHMRLLYGYTLRQVAEKAGLSHMEVQYVEQGQRTLTPEIGQRIMAAMYALNMEAAKRRARKQKREQKEAAEDEQRPAAD